MKNKSNILLLKNKTMIQIKWMKRGFVLLFSLSASLCATGQGGQPEGQAVLRMADKVFEYQQAHPTGKEMWEWEYGAYYSGLFDLYRVHPDVKYLEAMIAMGEAYKWSVRPRPYDANVLAIGHMYLGLYRILHNPLMIDKTVYCLDATFVRHPAEPDVTFEGNRYWWNWWSWCDALFMAPPVFALYAQISGEKKYLDKMHELWMITYNYLYDKKEHLFYRDDRFFKQRSPNGKKIFWARGEGWAISGLVKVLQAMPASYEHYPFYLDLYKEMALKIKSIQLEGGYWPPSLLDPGHYGSKETSGTAFFCYALAWGINNGILPREEYAPCVYKAWEMLVSCVNDGGMLGYVQRVGDAPDKVLPLHTETYGSGGFLMAASEVYRMGMDCSLPADNRLTEQEKKDGWQLLFEGQTMNGWRRIYTDRLPEYGWRVEDGCLIVERHEGGESSNGGDLVTRKEYSDFELTFDFRITAGANSGIKYFVDESLGDPRSAYGYGPEYQIIDDGVHPIFQTENIPVGCKMGGLYELKEAPDTKKVNPPGQWNTGRIVSKDRHVEHWLNGERMLSYVLGSDEFKEWVRQSKFKDKAGYGQTARGHILIQDHGDKVSYKNMKIKELNQ
jgi:rhamnogalacturonyl hydrolase YesR